MVAKKNTKKVTLETAQKLDRTLVKRSSDFVTQYINNTQFGYSNWDVQMACGRVEISRDGEHNYIDEVVLLIMTPEHAKAMLNALKANLEGFEKEHGEIIMRTPKSEQND